MTSRDRLIRFGLPILLAVLLATPVVVKYMEGESGRASAPAAMPADEALSRYGFHMVESSHAAGIDFLHEAPVLDPKLDHIMETVASMGAAVSVADYDRDGWPDIYTVTSRQGGRNALYRNLGDGTFRDVAQEVGLAAVNAEGTGVSMGAVWGDYDNDGYEDLFLYKWGQPELFHNEGGRRFTPVGAGAALPDWINANTAVWLDYDRDGLLDLFVGGYYPETVDLWHLDTTRIMPDSFEYATNGGRKYLLHNLGGGRFEEVAEAVGIVSRRWSLAAVAADFDGDGYPDLFIANDYGVSELFLNEGGERFREAGRDAGVGYAPKSGMNASLGDVFNDGRLSIYVSNISERGVLVQGNNLWVPDVGSTDGELRYENLANGMGVEMGGWSFGAQFGDLNNDGFLDIYATNGYVSLDRERSYWYDFSKVAGGNEAIISDAANWPPLAGRNLAGFQQKRVWLNDGYGRFREVSQMVGVTDVYDGRAVAIADFGNRGALDVVVANQRAPLLLYRNSVAPSHWLELELEGRRSNRSAIGARVTVFWSGGQQLQEVSGGSGFGAQNDRRLHFGLGDATRVDRVEIRWPSGATQVVESPEVDRIQKIQESE